MRTVKARSGVPTLIPLVLVQVLEDGPDVASEVRLDSELRWCFGSEGGHACFREVVV